MAKTVDAGAKPVTDMRYFRR